MMQKKITPDHQRSFVNVAQWLTLLAEQATFFGIPVNEAMYTEIDS